jgi:hypothetical protein
VPANFPAPAPAGPYAKSLSAFDGTDPNGTWKLFIIDDSPGSSGAVANNWALQITTETAPPPDTTAPKVLSTVPQPGATGVSPTGNVRATFSESVRDTTVNTNTFKLFRKGSTTEVAATVIPNANLSAAETTGATLDPTRPLKRGVTYKAVVTTGVKDLAGNALDQNATTAGNQPKAWFFTVQP